MGTREHWLRAEQRWRQLGVTSDEILQFDTHDLPFDKHVGTFGFALTGRWTVTAAATSDPRALFELFRRAEGLRTRAAVAELLLAGWVGQKGPNLPLNVFEQAAAACKASPRDIVCYPQVVDRLTLGAQIPDGVVRSLDAYGQLEPAKPGRPARVELTATLAALTGNYPDFPGLWRLLAATVIETCSEGLPVLSAPPNGEPPEADVVIRILSPDLDDPPAARFLTALARGPAWRALIQNAMVTALQRNTVSDNLLASLHESPSLLLAPMRAQLGEALEARLAAGTSPLQAQETWSRLGLFAYH